MKSKYLFFLCVCLGLLLVACKSQQNAGENTADVTLRRTTDPVTLSFWHTFNADETLTLEQILKDFKQEYPHISVELQQVPFSDALNKYKTVAQAGQAPDVFRSEISWTTELASLGYLMSLDAFLDDAAQQDFLPASLRYAKYKGHIWGVPQVTDCLALFYNKQMVGEPPKTLDELVSIGKQLTSPGQQYGFFYRGDPYWYTPFVWAFGGELIDSDTLEVKIAEPPAVAALQFLKDLREKHKIVPDSVDFANDYDNMMIGFKNGEYAMIMNGPWSTADALKGPEFANPDNLGITRIPAGAGGYGSPTGGHNYVVSSTTEKLFAAWDLVNFLSRPEYQAKFALQNNLLPTRESTYQLPAVQSNRIIQDFKYVLDAANTRPVIPQSGALFIDLKPAYQAALLNDKTPQAALNEVKKAWQNLLETD